MTLINTVQADGQGSVPAAQLNAYLQTVPNLAALRAFIPRDAMACQLQGFVSQNDGGQGIFVWNATATGPDDGVDVIQPIGVTVGAWIRDDTGSAGPPGPPGPTGPAGPTGPTGPMGPAGAGVTPIAGQMCINDGFDWVAQSGIASNIFWVPWDRLTTNSTGTPAYNPDGICTLTAPVGMIAADSFEAPPGAGTPGATFPGIVIPTTGYYYLYTEINVFYTIAGPVTEQICAGIFTWDSTGATLQFLDSDTQLILTNTEPPQESQALRVAGGCFLTAGSVVCVRLANTSGVNLANHLLLDEFSWFGAFRIR